MAKDETKNTREAPEAATSNPPDTRVDAVSGQEQAQPIMAGGSIARVLEADPAPEPTRRDLAALYARAAASPVAQKLGAAIGRPISEWGLLEGGDVVHGHMILVDLESGEKVEVPGGGPTTLPKDRLYANARNFPQFLVEGDALQQALGA